MSFLQTSLHVLNLPSCPCCHGDCLLCFWFVTSTLSTFYGTLPVPPPSDKRSAVHLLRTLHGNTPNSLLFLVFLRTLEEWLHSVMETGLQTRGGTTDWHQSQNTQLLDSRTQQVVQQTAVDRTAHTLLCLSLCWLGSGSCDVLLGTFRSSR